MTMVMNCAEFEAEWIDRIDQPVDSPRAWSPAARAHLAACEACRKQVSVDAALDSMIAQWRVAPQPAGDLEAILRRLLPPSPIHASSSAGVGPGPTRIAVATATVSLSDVQVRDRGESSSWLSFGLGITAMTLLFTAGLFWTTRNSGPGTGLARREIPSPETQVPLFLQPENLPRPENGQDVQPVVVTDTMQDLWQAVHSRSALVARSTVQSLDPWTVAPEPDLQAVVEPISRSDSSGNAAAPWPSWGAPVGQQVTSAFRFLGDALPAEPVPAS